MGSAEVGGRRKECLVIGTGFGFFCSDENVLFIVMMVAKLCILKTIELYTGVCIVVYVDYILMKLFFKKIDILCTWIGSQYYPMLSTDTVQSLSKFQWQFFYRTRKTNTKIHVKSHGSLKSQKQSLKRRTMLEISHVLF